MQSGNFAAMRSYLSLLGCGIGLLVASGVPAGPPHAILAGPLASATDRPSSDGFNSRSIDCSSPATFPNQIASSSNQSTLYQAEPGAMHLDDSRALLQRLTLTEPCLLRGFTVSYFSPSTALTRGVGSNLTIRFYDDPDLSPLATFSRAGIPPGSGLPLEFEIPGQNEWIDVPRNLWMEIDFSAPDFGVLAAPTPPLPENGECDGLVFARSESAPVFTDRYFAVTIRGSIDCDSDGIPEVCDELGDDCNMNGRQDADDIRIGTSLDCNLNVIPDECELADGTAFDCNGNTLLDACEIDCNGNGLHDECDIATGTSIDCDANAIPDECEPNFDCNGNSTQDICDIAAGSSDDCNENRVPDQCDMQSGASRDCNGNAIPDECDISFGTSLDCDTNAIPDECDPNFDCNGNGIQDICDIAVGSSLDCNENRVPDECDVATPDGDCNSNGLPDECDVTDGTSQDCNGNLVPDECDVAPDNPLDCNANGVPDGCEFTSVDLARITADNAAAGDRFGTAVAADTDLAVVGAPFRGGDDTGAAYVFAYSNETWQQLAQLSASNPTSSAQFGSAVAVGGGTIVVGATQGDGARFRTGTGHLFREIAGSWQEVALLAPNDGSTGDRLGVSVAIHENTVVVGAEGDDDMARDAGAAYLYAEVGGVWQLIAKLTASDGAIGDEFGHSVAISGNTIVVGAHLDDDRGADSGSAYVFRFNFGVWNRVAKLTASDGNANHQFGASVALNNGHIFIGAPFADSTEANSGAVYVFTEVQGTWMQAARLGGSAVSTWDQFGCSLAVGDRILLAGARMDQGEAVGSGTTYVFRGLGAAWQEIDRWAATDSAAGDNFGASVALSGSTAILGTPLSDGAGGNSGSAHVFSLPQAFDCDSNGVPDECEIDSDGDYWPDTCDQCPAHPDQIVAGTCECGVSEYDTDADGVPDCVDNCVLVPNPAQVDTDENGLGDACDPADSIFGCADFKVRLIASDASPFSYFGNAVSVSGNTAVIGASWDDSIVPFGGAAYVFERRNGLWTQQAKLNAANPQMFDHFGRVVAIHGDTIAVSAPSGPITSGLVDIFVRTDGQWMRQATLTGMDLYGVSLALQNDTLLVGAPGRIRVWAYVRSNGIWSPQGFLAPNDGHQAGSFGASVSLDGDTAFVGSHSHTHQGVQCGSVYVFVRANGVWSLDAELLAADRASGNLFGNSVSFHQDTAIVGSSQDDDQGVWSGSVYIFERDGGIWTQRAKLLGDGVSDLSYFGHSVTLSGSTALVGSYGDSVPGNRSGAAYVFVREGEAWLQRARLVPPEPSAFDEFGYAVALDGETALIGSQNDTTPQSSAGSAYVYTIATSTSSPDCNENEIPDGCEPDWDGDGVIDVCDDDLDGDGVPNDADACPLNPPGAPTHPDGRPHADLIPDCRINLSDFAAFATCFGGNGVTMPPLGCTPADFSSADFDGDGDVDLIDFLTFSANFTG